MQNSSPYQETRCLCPGISWTAGGLLKGSFVTVYIILCSWFVLAHKFVTTFVFIS